MAGIEGGKKWYMEQKQPTTHLQRSSCEQKAIPGLVHGAQRLRELALSILHAVSLVHDDVLPRGLAQDVLVLIYLFSTGRTRRGIVHVLVFLFVS